MRPESEIAGLLWDAREFAHNAQIAVGDASLLTYLEGGPIAWATERQMELIGEALSKLRQADPELAERIPNIHRIISMRNVLAHGYLVINDRVVWQAATEALPELIVTLEKLLDEFGTDLGYSTT
ncbi:MAG: HepT-like ribonuclease domain-containing protein [Ancrocorticia sp.]|uniref:HepT-like ribonuclease domain-containing protein n=1 Tax=Ancrocorticia sp. TaxID=2593684 RepID=UPI003F8E5A47